MFTKKIKNFTVDAQLFHKHLSLETQLLNSWLMNNHVKTEELKAGEEIEFLLLDSNYQLAPHNEAFVKSLNDKQVVIEAGTSQLEINTSVLPFSKDFLSTLHKNILSIWDKCCNEAKKNGQHLALIGSMPKTQHHFFSSSYITPNKDILLMNEHITKYRNGQPLSINLKGPQEKLQLSPQSLAIEGLICSFQLHLEVPTRLIAHYFNVVQLVSAPLLALSCNAPFFLGKKLWSESRIGLFEQLYTFPRPFCKTVFMESNYFQESIFPIFKNNVQNYPFLLPIAAFEEPLHHMFHVRCQNSCLFRWNRPILDFNTQQEPYFRIEHRALSTGPTVIDMIANAAFFYGITYYFANTSVSLSSLVNSKNLLYNFYKAAHFGLKAQLKWKNSFIEANALLKHLLPLAFKGLIKLGINTLDAKYYLNIINNRLEKKQNGSVWQQNYISKNKNDFQGMLHEYIQNQYSETPIADWKIK